MTQQKAWNKAWYRPADGLLWVLLCVSPAFGSQTSPDRPLVEILNEVRDSGIALVFSSDLVPADLRASFPAAPADPLAALRLVLATHDLALEQAGDVWLVVAAARDPASARTGHVAGVVRDSVNQQRLEGVRIELTDSARRTRTRSAGDFAMLDLPVGRYTLLAEAAGYPALRQPLQITAGRTTVTTLLLEPPRTQLETLVVSASRYAMMQRALGSFHFVSQDQLEQVPELGRETLRSIARLPGTATGGLSAKTNIRGGEEDEVAVLFNGITLHEPFHLKNFQEVFSIVDSRVVGGMEVFTGGFPAQYGDRLSGVIDMRAIEPLAPARHEIYVDLFNLGALSNGLFSDGRGEWLVSARRGNLDLLSNVVSSDFGRPSYFDGFARVAFDTGEAFAFSVNAMVADDSIRLRPSKGAETADADHRSTYLWAELEHRPGPALSYRSVVSVSEGDSQRIGSVNEPGDTMGQVRDLRQFRILQLKQDWSFSPSERFLSRWGFDFRRVEADYDYASEVQFEDEIDLVFLPEGGRSAAVRSRPDGDQLGLYWTNRVQVSKTWTAELGLRWDQQSYTTPDSDNQTSPRLSLLWQPAPSTALRASWGRFYQAQAINELQVEDGVGQFFPAQRADHLIVGLEHRFRPQLRARLEVYRKEMGQLRPRFENLFDPIELLPELQSDRVRVAPDSATSEGIELLFTGGDAHGNFNWWASLSHSRVADRIAGREELRSWDQRDALGFGLLQRHGLWTFSLAGRYHTGWPLTVVRLETDGPGGEPQVVVEPRNGGRLPDYATLDFRASRRKPLPRGALTWYVEITNLSNRDNPCCISYDLDTAPDGSPLLDSEFDNWLPVVPSVGLIWEF